MEPILPYPSNVSREELVSAAVSHPRWDLVVIGGGIHGAAVANYAAALGFPVLLLEMADYAAATSSRSSKMVHGGLRYLELFDFQQVFEGIKAREDLFEHAAHLVRPEQFLIPVDRGDYWMRLKMHLGLWLYDRFVRNPQHRHQWIPRQQLQFEGFHAERQDLMGCFLYTDGLMDDARLVLDNILAARERGSCCLNYAKVESIRQNFSGVEVAWRDEVSGLQHHSLTRLVINCAGPWAPFLREEKAGGASPMRARYSRGAHLLFARPWKGPSLFLPLPGKARYYFVWPHPGGTLVGTTEGETEELELDPQVRPEEVKEILRRLAKDLPGSGLDESSLYYAYCGIRTLPLRAGEESARLSRKHRWSYERGVLSLLGGKFTTFSWTAYEGLKQAQMLLSLPAQRRVPDMNLPGKFTNVQEYNSFLGICEKYQTPRILGMRALARFGRRALEFATEEGVQDCGGVLKGEIALSLHSEQVVSLEDLLRRRLGLELLPGYGLDALAEIVSQATAYIPRELLHAQHAQYEARVAEVKHILQTALISEIK